MDLLFMFNTRSQFSQKPVSKCFNFLLLIYLIFPQSTNITGHVEFTEKVLDIDDLDLKGQRNTEEESWIWSPH